MDIAPYNQTYQNTHGEKVEPSTTVEQKITAQVYEQETAYVAPSTSTPQQKEWVIFTWLQELFVCISGILMIVAICVLLRFYEGKQWPVVYQVYGQGINLTSILSLLTDMSKAAVTSVLGSCLSQLMWNRLWKNGFKLSEFSKWDNATRSQLLGGSFLTFSRKASLLSCLSYVLVLSTFVFGFTTQNALDFEEPSRPVSLPRCRTLPSWNQRFPELLEEQFTSTLFGNGWIIKSPWEDQVTQRLNGECFGGVCSWPKYSTVALCANFTEITDSIEKDCSTGDDGQEICNYSLPGRNVSLEGVRPQSKVKRETNFIASTTKAQTINYEEFTNPVAKVSMLQSSLLEDRDNNFGVDAFEGVYHWCVKSYNTTVASNILNNTEMERYYDPGATYSGSGDTAELEIRIPDEKWEAFGIEDEDGAVFKIQQEVILTMPYFRDAWESSNEDGQLLRRWNGYPGYLRKPFYEYFANIFTNRARYDMCFTPQDRAIGSQTGFETLLKVNWFYLASPIGSMFLTTLLLLGVMITKSVDGYFWKGSLEALLFHGLTEDVQQKYKTAEALTIKAMETKAEEIRVELRNVQATGFALSGETCALRLRESIES